MRLRLAIGVTCALLAMLLVAPQLPLAESTIGFRIALYASHAAWFTLVVTLVVVIAAAWRMPARALAGAIVLSFILAMGCNVLELSIAADIAKLWFGALAGAAFIRAVERPWWLLPIVVCVPLADAWSVFSERGVTNAVIDRAREEPRWIEWPTIATPIAGVPYELFGRLGTVDILFAGLFVAAAMRWPLGVRRVAIALGAGLLSTTIVVYELDDLAVPALPMICIAFLVATAPALVRDARAAMREPDADGPPDRW